MLGMGRYEPSTPPNSNCASAVAVRRTAIDAIVVMAFSNRARACMRPDSPVEVYNVAMNLSCRGLLPAIVVGAAVILSRGTAAQSPDKIDFARDVQPLLRANCYGCHGASLQNGNFRLDRRRDSMPNRVGANGARVVPGNSAASRLYVRVSSNQAGVQ